jgi:hypothetical protein
VSVESDQPSGLLPHRALALLRLAGVVFVCGVASCEALCCVPVTILLGCVVSSMCRADLRAMREGAMDPRGQQLTRQALLLGIAGAFLSAGGAMVAVHKFGRLVM